MILAAVKFRPEQFRSLQQGSVKYAEMADIVVGTQIINGKVRFEVKGDHIIHVIALKCGFITINIISTLLTDYFHIFIQRTGMQDIIMIKQTDILARCHRITLVRIA